MKGKKFSVLTVSLIPICVAVNVIGGQIASGLKLPIYLDSIGTFLVGALCGPIPGAAAGLITAIVSAMFSPIMIAYFPITMIYGLVIGILASRKMLISKGRVFLSGIMVAAIGVGLASLVTAFVFGGVTETGQSFVIALFRAVGLGVLPATMLSSLLTEICDKLLALYVCYFIIRNMSSRYLSRLPLGWIYLKKWRK